MSNAKFNSFILGVIFSFLVLTMPASALASDEYVADVMGQIDTLINTAIQGYQSNHSPPSVSLNQLVNGQYDANFNITGSDLEGAVGDAFSGVQGGGGATNGGSGSSACIFC